MVEAALLGTGEGEHRHRCHVVEGDRADDHQAGRPSGAVEILQKGGPKQSDAAAVAHLDEFPPQGALPAEQAEGCGQKDGAQGGQKAEEHKGAVPHGEEVGFHQILEEHDRQPHLEDEIVELVRKSLAEKAQPAEHQTQQHQQKDGGGGVEAVGQILQHGILLPAWSFSLL